MAAFIDGRLDRTARGRVVEHVSDCGECREVVLASRDFAGEHHVVSFLPQPSRRVWNVAIAGFAVAAMLMIVLGPLLRQKLFAPRVGIPELVHATADWPYRKTLARISGGFPYRETHFMRGPQGEGDTESLRFTAAAGEIEAAVAHDRSVENQHALGVAYLIRGDSRATEMLENALTEETHQPAILSAIQHSKNADLLSDLAAAYHTRIRAGDLSVQAKAIEAANAAWQLEQKPEIAWNRALVIESLHIPEDAQEAWRDYLRLDPSSPWSTEARERLEAVSKPTESELWPPAKKQLAMMSAATSLVTLVNPFRQQVRLWCEDELLPAWGSARLKRDAAAEELLRQVSRIGEALEAASGETLIRRTTDAIHRAEGADVDRLARGHIAYGEGRRAFSESKASESLRQMNIAVAALPPSLTPFAVRAQTEQAAAIYMLNEYPRALQIFQRLLAAQERAHDSSVVVTGRLQWAVGMLNLQVGNPAVATQHFRQSLDLFRRAGERDYEAVLHTLLADVLVSAGKEDEAREQRDQAMALLEETGNDQHKHAIIFEGAYAAILNAEPALAELLLNRVVAHDIAAADSVEACTSLMWRSAYRSSMKRNELARLDLDDARGVCGRIEDAAVRQRALANLGIAQAIVGRGGDVRADLQELDGAVSYFEKSESRVWLRTAYLTRGRARAAAGDPVAAERDYRAAVAQSESTREKIEEADARVSFAATADEVIDEYVDFLIVQRRPQEAFGLADRSRARELVDSPSARWKVSQTDGANVHALQAGLPSNVAVIEYRVLDGHIVAWVVQKASLDTIAVPVSAAEVKWLLDELGSALSERRWRIASASLYDALIRPLEPVITSAASLVVIPDDVIERVPFAGLYNPQKARYMVEMYATVVAPSLAIFEESTRRFRERAQDEERVLVVNGPSGGASGEFLEAAAREGEVVSESFPSTRVVPAFSPHQLFDLPSDVTVLHFAGHAVAGTSVDSARELVLGTGSEAHLKIAAILALPLAKIRLAYLATCGSDEGPVLKSEGSTTVGHAFFAAGVPVVIATSWGVSDKVAGDMTRLFYHHLRQGLLSAEALRQSQLELMERGSAPVDWSSFRVIGAGIELGKTPS